MTGAETIELRMRCVEAAIRKTRTVTMKNNAIVAEARMYYDFVIEEQEKPAKSASAPVKTKPRASRKKS